MTAVEPNFKVSLTSDFPVKASLSTTGACQSDSYYRTRGYIDISWSRTGPFPLVLHVKAKQGNFFWGDVVHCFSIRPRDSRHQVRITLSAVGEIDVTNGQLMWFGESCEEEDTSHWMNEKRGVVWYPHEG